MHARKSERRERLVPGQGTKVNFDFCPYDFLKIEAETVRRSRGCGAVCGFS